MLDEATLTDVFDDGQQGALLKLDSDNRTPAVCDLLHHSGEQGCGAIYVATERPYVTVKENLDTTEHVYFIDCVVKTLATQRIADQDRVTLLPKSQNVQDLLAAIPAAYKTLSHDRVVLVVESLSALTTYNRTHPVQQFFESLQEQVDTLGLQPIMLVGEDVAEDRLSDDLSGLADNVVDVQ